MKKNNCETGSFNKVLLRSHSGNTVLTKNIQALIAWALAKAVARTLARAQAQTQVLAQAARALA